MQASAFLPYDTKMHMHMHETCPGEYVMVPSLCHRPTEAALCSLVQEYPGPEFNCQYRQSSLSNDHHATYDGIQPMLVRE